MRALPVRCGGMPTLRSTTGGSVLAAGWPVAVMGKRSLRYWMRRWDGGSQVCCVACYVSRVMSCVLCVVCAVCIVCIACVVLKRTLGVIVET